MHPLPGHVVPRRYLSRLYAVHQHGARDLDRIEREAAEARA